MIARFSSRITLADGRQTVFLGSVNESLEANQERDSNYAIVRRQLLDEGWLDRGCIVFSQYFDSVWWLAGQLSNELPDEPIGI